MSSSRTNTRNTTNTTKTSKATDRWADVLRSPWTVACAVVSVVIGPAAVTASALDRANAAPLHHAHAYETAAPRTVPPYVTASS
ncbi:hypothetical protein AB5J56_32210 [Streptomyces sp. R21]|uniref:Uncharacterized protein n=1 Tax=Streptomyces sp. R21 TaxID=3238627 RepID=A0AB39PDC9_9ACTN